MPLEKAAEWAVIAAEAIDFVEDHQGRFPGSADLVQHGVHGLNLFVGLGMADIDDVQQQVGLHHFFKCCLGNSLARIGEPGSACRFLNTGAAGAAGY